MTDDDDDRLEFDAWTAPPPPAGLADRVLAAVSGRARATAVDDDAARPTPRRRWAYAAVGGALVEMMPAR